MSVNDDTRQCNGRRVPTFQGFITKYNERLLFIKTKEGFGEMLQIVQLTSHSETLLSYYCSASQAFSFWLVLAGTGDWRVSTWLVIVKVCVTVWIWGCGWGQIRRIITLRTCHSGNHLHVINTRNHGVKPGS